MKVSFYMLMAMSLIITQINADEPTPTATDEVDEVIVTSSILNPSRIINPLYVINGDEIEDNATTSLGEAVDSYLGVSIADYGAAVGQPIIRGMSGPRVKILKNGLSIRTNFIDSGFNENLRYGYDKSQKLVKFICNFAPLVTENLEKKINKKKLEKELISKLNKSFLKYKFPIKLPKESVQIFNSKLTKNKISIKKINLNEQLEYQDYYLPETNVGISYLIQYKGLNNRLALKV